jgi:hypothetical protein
MDNHKKSKTVLGRMRQILMNGRTLRDHPPPPQRMVLRQCDHPLRDNATIRSRQCDHRAAAYERWSPSANDLPWYHTQIFSFRIGLTAPVPIAHLLNKSVELFSARQDDLFRIEAARVLANVIETHEHAGVFKEL